MILLDLMMPGTNGWDFRRQQLQQPRHANIPVLLMSGIADLPQQAASLQITHYLRKPISVATMLAMIDSAGIEKGLTLGDKGGQKRSLLFR